MSECACIQPISYQKVMLIFHYDLAISTTLSKSLKRLYILEGITCLYPLQKNLNPPPKHSNSDVVSRVFWASHRKTIHHKNPVD